MPGEESVAREGVARIGFQVANDTTGKSQAWTTVRLDAKTTAEQLVRHAILHAVERLGGHLDADPQSMRCFLQDGGDFVEIAPLMKRLLAVPEVAAVLAQGRRVNIVLASTSEAKTIDQLPRLASSPSLSTAVRRRSIVGSPFLSETGEVSLLTPLALDLDLDDGGLRGGVAGSAAAHGPRSPPLPSIAESSLIGSFVIPPPVFSSGASSPSMQQQQHEQEDGEFLSLHQNSTTGQSNISGERCGSATVLGADTGDAVPLRPTPRAGAQPHQTAEAIERSTAASASASGRPPAQLAAGAVTVVYYSPLGKTATLAVTYHRGELVAAVVARVCETLNRDHGFNLDDASMTLLYVRSDGDLRSFARGERLPVSSKAHTLYLSLDSASLPQPRVSPSARTAPASQSPDGRIAVLPEEAEMRALFELDNQYAEMDNLLSQVLRLKRELVVEYGRADTIAREIAEAASASPRDSDDGAAVLAEKAALQAECATLSSLCEWFEQKLHARGTKPSLS